MTAAQHLWAPWALPIATEPARDVLITIRDGRIDRLEAGIDRDAAARRTNVQLFDDCILMPGFVNAHAHIEYAAFGGMADGLTFTDWIIDHIRRKARLGASHMRASAKLGAIESLYGGITTVADASYSGDAAFALVEAGLRGRVYLEVFGAGVDPAEIVDGCLQRLADLPSTKLVEHGISPHAPYTVDEQLYRHVAATGLPWMTHMLESADEVLAYRGVGDLVESQQRAGRATPTWSSGSPIEQLADVLSPSTVIVHGVHARPSDFEVLAAAGAPLVHCPRSNARLGCGVLDLVGAERAGVRVALGTDSPSSAGRLSAFDEVRAMLLMHRAASEDSTAPTAAAALQMMTLDAAAALGFSDVGALNEGWKADVIAIRSGAVADPAAFVATDADVTDVTWSMIDGRGLDLTDRSPVQQARADVADARKLLALPTPRRVAR